MFWKAKKSLPKNEKAQDDSSELLSKKISPSETVNVFVEEFKTSLTKINELAKSNITDWHAYLKELDIATITIAQREKAKSSGLALPEIAFPAEYRNVLKRLKQDYKQQLKQLQKEVEDDFDADDLLDEFVRRIYSSLIQDELGRYLNSTKPAVSISDIFANASPSINKYSVKKEDMGDKSYSIKCKTCGAARLEEDQYDDCFYCGTPLFK